MPTRPAQEEDLREQEHRRTAERQEREAQRRFVAWAPTFVQEALSAAGLRERMAIDPTALPADAMA